MTLKVTMQANTASHIQLIAIASSVVSKFKYSYSYSQLRFVIRRIRFGLLATYISNLDTLRNITVDI